MTGSTPGPSDGAGWPRPSATWTGTFWPSRKSSSSNSAICSIACPVTAWSARVGEGKGRFGERCPIFFRRDRLRLLDWRSHRLPRSSPPRIATSARFAFVEGPGAHPPEIPPATFQVFNLHLDHRSPETRRNQAAAVLGFAQTPAPTLVMGDLNEPPTGPALRLLLRTGLRDALGGLPAEGARAATYHGFTGALDGQRIDHILTSPHWEVERAEVVRGPRMSREGTNRSFPPGAFPPGSFPSDHWPILAELRLKPGDNPAGA